MEDHSSDNPLKRKHHVTFSEDTRVEEPVALTGGMHPDRLAALEQGGAEGAAERASKKQKVKTEAQKRYQAKKVKKRKKVLKAQKDSAPKSTKEPFQPSTSSQNAPTDPVPALSPTDATKPSAIAALEALQSKKIAPEDETPDQRQERRRLEKKAKREVRRAEEAVEAEKEKEKQAERQERERVKAEKKAKKMEEKKAAEIAAAEEDSQEDDEDEDGNQLGDNDDVEMTSEPEAGPSSRGPTPELDSLAEGLTPFPLPTGPAKPSAALLSAQGMPAALKDAVLIDDTLKVGLKAMRLLGRSRKGKEREVTEEGLAEGTVEKLNKMGIEEFFAVQAALLPELAALPLTPLPTEFLHDYLVSAPTGSGKTLAYGVPLVQILSKRVVTRLRALIILPTRDLVQQVRETLGQLAKGTNLKIGVATGQHSFAQEQAALVDNQDDDLLGGSSKVDILIATPGRLMDHLQGTRNFSLQHLRFLVVDEADRLLTQSFQGWLAEVLKHLKPKKAEGRMLEIQGEGAVAGSWYEETFLNGKSWEGSIPLEHTCQKLLFSATLTRDPSKIAALQLRNPRYLIVRSELEEGDALAGDLTSQQFAIPAGLTERMIVMPPELKPLNLLHLLHSPTSVGGPVRSALCFTKSVDSSERLLKLLSFFEDAYLGGGGKKLVVKGYSSELAGPERKTLLNDFKEGKIDLLVCSDLIARGIDLPSVTHVISYDVPIDMRKYVHRVGRTARAGREGVAWSLVEKQEARHFKAMLTAASHFQRVKKVKLKDEDFVPYQESYQIALGRLKEAYVKA